MKVTIRFVVLFLFMFSMAVHAQFGNPFSVVGTLDESSVPPLITIKASIPENHYLYAKDFVVTDAAGVEQAPVQLPEISYMTDPASGEKKAVYSKSFEVQYTWEPSDAGVATVVINYLGCNDVTCFMPQIFEIKTSAIAAPVAVETQKEIEPTDAVIDAVADWKTELDGFDTVDTAVGFLDARGFLAFLNQEESANMSGFELFIRDPTAFVGREGIVWTVIFILLGGLLLNLTPCVLPMIPINLAIIGAGAQASSRKRGFALGAVYGAGIALVYGLVGVIVVLTGSSFGAIQSSPWFNLVIAVVFLVLALAMFDKIHIDFSRFQSKLGGSEQKKQGSYLLALSMGSVSALLAGACVAPVVIAVLILASKLGAVGLMLPFVLGLGMALPWPFAGAGLSFLPKPGQWMVYVKYVFGVGIILFALYYGNLSFQGFRSVEPSSSEDEAGHLVVDGSTNDGFAAALEKARTSGKPVLIDFWASWCKNCKAMDRTFKHQTVASELDEYIFIKYIAENPGDPTTKQVMDQFGVQGLPTFVLLAPNK